MKTHIHLQSCVKEHMDYRNPSKVNAQAVCFGWLAGCGMDSFRYNV